MPVTITFHRMYEKKPKHGDSVIWLQKQSVFDSYGFEPREITAEYIWDELTEDGEYTGTSVGYGGETQEEMEGYRLSILFDCQYAEEGDLWCYVEDYWGSFE